MQAISRCVVRAAHGAHGAEHGAKWFSSTAAGDGIRLEDPSHMIRFLDQDGDECVGQLIPGTDEATVLSILSKDAWTSGGSDVRRTVTRLLAPVEPTNIFAIGLNYAQHAAEAKLDLPREPVTFMKATSSVCAPFDPIVIPSCANDRPEVDFEGELAVCVG